MYLLISIAPVHDLTLYKASFFNLERSDISTLFGIHSFASAIKYYDINYYYYLFKKFLVSDWLTANCEIVYQLNG
jgi:hypothetical protein